MRKYIRKEFKIICVFFFNYDVASTVSECNLLYIFLGGRVLYTRGSAFVVIDNVEII